MEIAEGYECGIACTNYARIFQTYECYERDYIGPAAELRVFNQEMIDDMGRTRQISLQADGKGGRRNVL